MVFSTIKEVFRNLKQYNTYSLSRKDNPYATSWGLMCADLANIIFCWEIYHIMSK